MNCVQWCANLLFVNQLISNSKFRFPWEVNQFMNGVQIISQEAITTARDMPTILLILSMFIILPITFYFGKKNG